jgi:hypothetical protein
LGNFSISLDNGIFKSLLFKITQHEKDEVLLNAIKDYLNCGYCYLRKKENLIDFKVTKFSDITEIIIPFFINNPILGIKSLDFKDWYLVSEIVKKREHKQEENILKIKEIQKGMNRGRSFEILILTFYVLYGPGLAVNDFSLGIYYMLAVSSLATYGILLAGWSANSKYAFLGSLRSTAQLISYELVLSSAILLVIMLTGNLNLTVNTESQRAIWYVLPLLPIFIIFFIGSVAETNRAPFDLAEAIE